MSQNYASYYIPPSATQYNNYVASQVIGPLNSSQTPNVSGVHNLGVLNGVHPNPPQFYPADSASAFSQARFQYSRTNSSSAKQQMIAREKVLAMSRPMQFSTLATQKQFATSGHTNYIPPPASSLYTSVLKSQAVGKSSYKQGLSTQAPLSYKSHNNNDVRSSLRRIRGAGCVAPAKCRASTVCTKGGICNIGAYSGQGY